MRCIRVPLYIKYISKGKYGIFHIIFEKKPYFFEKGIDKTEMLCYNIRASMEG